MRRFAAISALTLGATLLALPGASRAGCNLIPVAAAELPSKDPSAGTSVVGYVDRPLAGPADSVTVRAGLACQPGLPGFAPPGAATPDTVTLRFHPPGAAASTDVTLAAAAVEPLRCGTTRCEALRFEIPDTSGLATGGLTGPAEIRIERDLGSGPELVARVFELYQPTRSCEPSGWVAEPVFGAFTVLPAPNALVSGTTGPFEGAVDGLGNLLVPMDFSAVLVGEAGAPVATILQATSVSALVIAALQDSGSDSDDLRSFNAFGRPIPPVLRIVKDPAASPAFFGTTDVLRSVMQVRPLVGLSYPALIPGDGRGAVSIPGANVIVQSAVPLAGFAASLEAVVASVDEALAGDRNTDADTADLVPEITNVATGIATDTAQAVASFTGSAARPALVAEGALVAYLQSEADSVGGSPASGDQNGDGDALDTRLRAFRVTPTSNAIELTLGLDAATASLDPVVAGRPLAISSNGAGDDFVFFRRNEADESGTGLVPSSVAGISVRVGYDVEVFATLTNPHRLVFEPSGNLLVTSTASSGPLRRLDPNGTPLATSANHPDPDDVAIDHLGRNLLTSGTNLRIELPGFGSVFASGFGNLEAVATAPALNRITVLEDNGLVKEVDAFGASTVCANFGSGGGFGLAYDAFNRPHLLRNGTLRRFGCPGSVTILGTVPAPTPGPELGGDIAFGPGGVLGSDTFVASGNLVASLDSDFPSSAQPLLQAGGSVVFTGLAFDANGELLVAEPNAGRVLRVFAVADFNDDGDLDDSVLFALEAGASLATSSLINSGVAVTKVFAGGGRALALRDDGAVLVFDPALAAGSNVVILFPSGDEVAVSDGAACVLGPGGELRAGAPAALAAGSGSLVATGLRSSVARVAAAGSRCVLLRSEALHAGGAPLCLPAAGGGCDLNGDGDAADDVPTLYDVPTGAIAGVGWSALDFIASADGSLLGFRTPEADEAAGVALRPECAAVGVGGLECDLNGDGDAADAVFQVYSADLATVVNTERAAIPCSFAACEAFDLYRVEAFGPGSGRASFLGTEVAQAVGVGCLPQSPAGDCDLDGDALGGGTVVHVASIDATDVAALQTLPADSAAAVPPFPAEVIDNTVVTAQQSECSAARIECPELQLLPAFGSTFGYEPGSCASRFDADPDGAAGNPNDVPGALDCVTPRSWIVGDSDRAGGIASGDGVLDFATNGVNDVCRESPDPAQTDIDGDGLGDTVLAACDPDPGSVAPATLDCDLDANGQIDQRDVDRIVEAIGRHAVGFPALGWDRRDRGADGYLTSLDSALCSTACTYANCALAPPGGGGGGGCGLLGGELLLPLGLVAGWRRRLRERRLRSRRGG